MPAAVSSQTGHQDCPVWGREGLVGSTGGTSGSSGMSGSSGTTGTSGVSGITGVSWSVALSSLVMTKVLPVRSTEEVKPVGIGVKKAPSWALVNGTVPAPCAEGHLELGLHMKCVRLHIGPDGLKASASNGLCVMEAEGDKQCKGQSELLLPARSLKTLASISKDSDVYEMGLTGKSLVFWNGTLLFSARLVEGKFPNTSGVFEQFKCQYSIHLDAAEFVRTLEVAESVSESNHRVELAFGEHEITVRAESACGKSSAPVKALVFSAPNQPFYYNFRKLLEYLRLEKEKITLEFDKSGLLMIRSGSTRYVQSPMRAPIQSAGSKAA